MAHLSHPNIIPIYNYGEEKGTTYIVMQLMQGGTLKRPHGEVYTPEEALRMLLPVTRALAYGHQHGIVHRDIKPSNILLTEDKWPVIADFGLVQMAEASARLTGSGMGLGTPAYMSPEQGQGGKVDQRSDIYSLGIVLYEMVTGDVPFHADTPVGVLLKHVTEPIPAAHEVNPAIPREVEAVILKAAAKDPQKRYQTAEEMAAAMEQALVRITTAGEKVVERKKVKTAPVPKRKDAGQRPAERKPFKPLKPAWRLRPIHLIAGGVVLVLVLAGIFVPRLLTGIARSVPTTNPGLPTWTAYPGATAPPTQKAATQTTGSPFTWSKVNDLPMLDRDQVNAIVIDPGNSNLVYVGTQNSGIYKSEDGGTTWTPSSKGLAGASIGSLLMNPKDPSELYAAVYSRGIYRSTDGGMSWQLSQDNQSGNTWPQCRNLAMDPGHPNRLYFSDGKNLFETENGGDSWTTMSTNLPEGVLCSLTIAGWDETNMWASVQDVGFFMSTDKGWTWNKWQPWGSLLPNVVTHEYDFYLDPYENGVMYVSFKDSNSSNAFILHSVDKGATWTSDTLNCTKGMAFEPNDHQVEYCATGKTFS